MPIKRCSLPGGGKGYKYGDSGKCYKSREQALKQMRAIKYSETHSETHSETRPSIMAQVVAYLQNKQINDSKNSTDS